MISIHYYLILSTLVFFIGVYGFLTRRNLIMLLMSVELMLNAVCISFTALNRYLFPHQLEGFFFSLFIIAIAAAETALAISIIINLYRKLRSVNVEDVSTMSE